MDSAAVGVALGLAGATVRQGQGRDCVGAISDELQLRLHVLLETAVERLYFIQDCRKDTLFVQSVLPPRIHEIRLFFSNS